MKGIRFSDTDDFNEIHDSTNIMLLENYHLIVERIIRSFNFTNYRFILKSSTITGEPRICKIAFPDAIISIDLEVTFPLHNIRREIIFRVAGEIKSHVKSFGETLRQLQISREWRKKTGQQMPFNSFIPVILITPDHRFDDAFISQGFNVLDPSFLGMSQTKSSLDDFQE
jgi:hypothetical protein